MTEFQRFFSNLPTAKILFGRVGGTQALALPEADWDIVIDDNLPNGFFYSIDYDRAPDPEWEVVQ